MQHSFSFKGVTLALVITFCTMATSCRSTKSVVTSTDSVRNSTEQVQRRSGRSISVDSLWRLTALSIDSLTLVFEGADTSATHEDGLPAGPISTASVVSRASNVTKAKPSAIKVYGIHLSQEEKKNAVAETCLSDSNAYAVQSSSDKSLTKSKAAPSTSFYRYAILFLIIIAIAIIVRYSSNKLHK